MEGVAVSIFISKSLTRVFVKTSTGDVYEGGVYLAEGERLQDMLNSDGDFIPFRTDEALMMLAKAQLVSVELIKG